MARLVGVWIYAKPRPPAEDVEISGGFTLILSEEDKRKLGDQPMTVDQRVYDWDKDSPDDLMYKDTSWQLGGANLNVGPNTFGLSAIVKHSDMKEEDAWQNTVELYHQLRVTSAVGVNAQFKNSEPEDRAKARFK
jgi:hypothetical protein